MKTDKQKTRKQKRDTWGLEMGLQEKKGTIGEYKEGWPQPLEIYGYIWISQWHWIN